MLAIKKRKETFYKVIKKYFPRVNKSKIEEPTSIISNKENKIATKQKLHPDLSDDEKPNPKTEFDQNYKEYFMSRFTESIMDSPELLQKMAIKVFSKHTAKEIREWSEKLMLRYSQTHATEAPTNLNIIPDSKLFANSEELGIPTKIFSEKKRENEAKENAENDNIIETEQKILNKNEEVFSKIKVVYEKAHVVAYLLCRMPFTFYVHKRILFEISLRMPDFKPKSVLDFGSGLGSGVW